MCSVAVGLGCSPQLVRVLPDDEAILDMKAVDHAHVDDASHGHRMIGKSVATDQCDHCLTVVEHSVDGRVAIHSARTDVLDALADCAVVLDLPFDVGVVELGELVESFWVLPFPMSVGQPEGAFHGANRGMTCSSQLYASMEWTRCSVILGSFRKSDRCDLDSSTPRAAATQLIRLLSNVSELGRHWSTELGVPHTKDESRSLASSCVTPTTSLLRAATKNTPRFWSS